jgi:hypothetical protein
MSLVLCPARFFPGSPGVKEVLGSVTEDLDVGIPGPVRCL